MYSPWVVFHHQLETFFQEDPEVIVDLDEDEFEITVYVHDPNKGEALSKLLPTHKDYGNRRLDIRVVTQDIEQYRAKYFEIALAGNKAFKHITSVDVMSNPVTYISFKKTVVQYSNDSLGDEHGICSTLYQDLAKEIFGDVDGVFFCTDTDY